MRRRPRQDPASRGSRGAVLRSTPRSTPVRAPSSCPGLPRDAGLAIVRRIGGDRRSAARSTRCHDPRTRSPRCRRRPVRHRFAGSRCGRAVSARHAACSMTIYATRRRAQPGRNVTSRRRTRRDSPGTGACGEGGSSPSGPDRHRGHALEEAVAASALGHRLHACPCGELARTASVTATPPSPSPACTVMVNRTCSGLCTGPQHHRRHRRVARGSNGACSKYAPSASTGSTTPRWTKTGPIACDRNVAEVTTPKLRPRNRVHPTTGRLRRRCSRRTTCTSRHRERRAPPLGGSRW